MAQNKDEMSQLLTIPLASASTWALSLNMTDTQHKEFMNQFLTALRLRGGGVVIQPEDFSAMMMNQFGKSSIPKEIIEDAISTYETYYNTLERRRIIKDQTARRDLSSLFQTNNKQIQQTRRKLFHQKVQQVRMPSRTTQQQQKSPPQSQSSCVIL